MRSDTCRCRRSTTTPRPCWRSRSRSCRASPRCWSTARRNSPCACRSIRWRRRRATSRSTTSAPWSRKANSNTPVGTLQGEKQTVTLLATGAMRSAADYRDVVVAYRNGAPVKLDEIANVIDSVENDKVATWFNDARAIVLAIQRQPDANTVEVVDRGARRAAGDARADPARDPDGSRCSTARSRSAPRSIDVQETLAIAICAGDHGDLPVPAQSVGHHHPGAGGAGLADRHLRGDVRLRLLDQQHDAAWR